jgi:hypothetical protein
VNLVFAGSLIVPGQPCIGLLIPRLALEDA